MILYTTICRLFSVKVKKDKPKSRKILLLDEDASFRYLFHMIINDKNAMESIEVSTCDEAIELCRKERFDIILLDHNVHNGIGWDIADEIYGKPDIYGKPKIIAIYGSYYLDSSALKRKHIDFFLEKPFSVDDLVNAINNLLREEKLKGG